MLTKQVLERLKQNNLKITKQRKDLINYLDKNQNRYVTLTNIDEQIRKLYPGMSHNTVYRNIKEFADAGIVEYRANDESMVKYQCNFSNPHHHHFICQECGNVTELDNCVADYFKAQLPGYIILNHSLEIYGICPDCQNKKDLDKLIV